MTKGQKAEIDEDYECPLSAVYSGLQGVLNGERASSFPPVGLKVPLEIAYQGSLATAAGQPRSLTTRKSRVAKL